VVGGSSAQAEKMTDREVRFIALLGVTLCENESLMSSPVSFVSKLFYQTNTYDYNQQECVDTDHSDLKEVGSDTTLVPSVGREVERSPTPYEYNDPTGDQVNPT
jgi:hypothetical protein